ncbi:MAG: sulfotransferase family protein [Immundisolibacter sp.]|uniref:sulfotransferase family protein n=1 Tax=Immundisolibacter sp. TaxID=1934948 RepID=UPI003EE1D477
MDGKNMAMQRVVFLVGAPRSGTTWLQLLLSSSPAVATANETHLFNAYLGGLFSCWENFQSRGRDIGLHHLFGKKEYFEKIRGFSDEVLNKILSRKPEATLVLEKTPAHVRCWKDILTVYPGAYFLHLVRDPRAVVASLRAAGRGWGKSWASPGVMENAHLWLRDVGKAVEIQEHTDHYLQVRYEDLMSAPAERLSALFSWMGLDHSVDDCQEMVEINTLDQLKKGAVKKPWDTRREPEGFFGGRGVEGWRKDLSGSEIKAIEHVTAPLAEKLGYFSGNKSLPGWREVVFSVFLRFDRWWKWYTNRLLTRL